MTAYRVTHCDREAGTATVARLAAPRVEIDYRRTASGAWDSVHTRWNDAAPLDPMLLARMAREAGDALAHHLRERWLHHLTLTTGHVRRSPRSEVADDVVEMLRPLLARAVDGDTVAVPGSTPLCVLRARRVTGGALLAVVALAGGGPLISLAVSGRSRSSSVAWAEITAVADIMRHDSPPPTPWCGVVLHPAIAQLGMAAGWLGDLERCIAWTWLERSQ